MPNISHIANLPTQNKRALHSLFTTKSDTVLLLGQKYIRETSALQLREDVEAPDGLLEEFFDLMVDHVTTLAFPEEQSTRVSPLPTTPISLITASTGKTLLANHSCKAVPHPICLLPRV
jgi:hypothetical protein